MHWWHNTFNPFLKNAYYITDRINVFAWRYWFFFFLNICANMRLVAKKHFLWCYLNSFFFFFLVMYGRHLSSIYCCNCFVNDFNGFNSIMIFYFIFWLYGWFFLWMWLEKIVWMICLIMNVIGNEQVNVI